MMKRSLPSPPVNSFTDPLPVNVSPLADPIMIFDARQRIGVADAICCGAGREVDRHAVRSTVIGDRIGPGTAIHVVVTGTALEQIVARTAGEGIVTGAAIQGIVAAATRQDVVARIAGQDIVGIVAGYVVCGSCPQNIFDTGQGIRPATAIGRGAGSKIDRYPAAKAGIVHGVGPGTARDDIVMRAAIDGVVTVAAIQEVIAIIAGEIIVTRCAIDHIDTGAAAIRIVARGQGLKVFTVHAGIVHVVDGR